MSRILMYNLQHCVSTQARCVWTFVAIECLRVFQSEKQLLIPHQPVESSSKRAVIRVVWAMCREAQKAVRYSSAL